MDKMKGIKNQNIKGWLYILPALIILSIFSIYPIIQSFTMGFYAEFDYLKGEVYKIGIDNFQYVLSDENLYIALRNTFLYVVLSVPISIIVSLVLATLLNSKIKFMKFFRSVYFLPFVTSTVAISMVWRWMLHGDYGLINSILQIFNISKLQFLTQPEYTIPILVVLSVWKGMGYKVIILLAGLQSIDEQYYLAAKIDGASKFQRFKNITCPLLLPALFFILITSIISGFKIFDEVFILYDQKTGPLKSGLTIVYYIFNKFYREWQFTNAAAASFILFLIIFVFTIIQLIMSNKLTRDK
ncbi:MAG: sugar ABC transporter permease [Paeniclostridium sordellii]|nr:sugar ABC transporter permease [Paeniclostridium sordellii]